PLVVQVTYTGYLALMSLLWGLLFVALLGGVYFPIMLLTRLARVGRPGETQMTRGQLLFLAGYLSLTTAASWLLPIWPVLVFAGVCWLTVVGLNLVRGRPGTAQLIWRSPRTRQVRAISMRRILLAVVTLAVLLLAALVLSAAGGRVLGQAEGDNTM